MLSIGITGGMACGKSTVRRALARAGWPTLDLDEVAHRLLAFGGETRATVLRELGDAVRAADGGVDRTRLGRLVFRDAQIRSRVNAIMHPRIREEERAWLARAEATGAALAFVDGALLIETGAHLRFDRVVVIHCEEQEQLRRMRDRNGLTEEQARARVAAQMPGGLKRRLGTDEIATNGSHEETERQVDAFVRGLRSASGSLGAVDLPLCRAAAALEVPVEAGSGGPGPIGVVAWMGPGGPGLDMARLADAMRPGGQGVWYERGPIAGEAASLMPALAVALVGMRRAEPGLAVAAAAAWGVLLEGESADVGRACLVMEATLMAVRERGLPVEWRSRLSLWRRHAVDTRAADDEISWALDVAAGRREGVAGDPVRVRQLSEALRRLGGGASDVAPGDDALRACHAVGIGPG
jgi:dephospho-CoA kinase